MSAGYPLTEWEVTDLLAPRAIVYSPRKTEVKACPHCSWCVLDTEPLSVYPAIRLEAHIKDRHTVQPTTPTPWIFDGGVRIGPPTSPAGIDVDLSQMVAMVYGNGGATLRGNANLIVRAVNSHEPMLAALKVTLEYWESTGFADCDEGCECIVDAVRAAIALAEGR